jgi:hypothetical protein
MEADELIAKAWKAVEKAGLPEALQPTAFKEAVDYLRSLEAPGSSPKPEGATGTTAKRSPTKRAATKRAASTPADPNDAPSVDEDTFFADLSAESGLPENDLRDVLNLTKDGKVQVAPPTRLLGKSQADQAKTVVALVASGRSKGLGEKPVDAEAVRREVDRKGCFQSNNFASKHLAVMKGFNAGSTKNEILLTSKWLEEFKAAVDIALERKPAEEAS